MANHKRASMREGPLADLFRKTETEGLEDAVPAQATQAVSAETPGAVPSSGSRSRERGGPFSGGPAHAEVEAATPGAGAGGMAPPQPPEPDPIRRSTPQDRLRQAFSADIPDDVLAAPPVASYQPPAPEPWPAPQSVGLPQLRVVGVGGAGVNAVNRMVEAEISGVEFLALNTDVQSLQQSDADITLQIGAQATRGLGSGATPELGRAAAAEDCDRIKSLLKGADMVFIAAGEGGGTGTGAAPLVARIGREVGALTVGIVTKPFGFEGARRLQQAERGIEALAEEVDTLIVVPNNRLLSVLDKQTSMVEAFRVADDVLRQGVQGISDLITLPGLINLDFADVRTIMSDAGPALLGIGMGQGPDRAIEAAQQAVSSPLLETSVEGARGILLSITGGPDLSLWEINEAAKAVQEAAHPEANIIFGAMVDEKLGDQVWITVVATGYGDGRKQRRRGGAGVREAAAFREPLGEPRVSRMPEGAGRAPRRHPMDIDVPEFLPRR